MADKKQYSDILNNPEDLAQIQVDDDEDEIFDARHNALQAFQKLPTCVKTRVQFLRKIQLDNFKIQGEFFCKMNDLEREFEFKQADIFKKRKEIVMGDFEPDEDDCKWEDDFLIVDPKTGQVMDEIKEKALQGDSEEKNKGIPNFWLTVFDNCYQLRSYKMSDIDDPILAHLEDIRTYVLPQHNENNGFVLEFYFGKNEYFSDPILTKTYYVRFDPSPKDPFSFEGPEIIKCKGCPINWYEGKNVTVSVVQKVVRVKNKQEKKTITSNVRTESFFNFFDSPTQTIDEIEGDSEEDVNLIQLLQSDFEIGQFFRDQVVSRAVLLYTGEGIDDEDFDEDEEETDDSDADS